MRSKKIKAGGENSLYRQRSALRDLFWRSTGGAAANSSVVAPATGGFQPRSLSHYWKMLMDVDDFRTGLPEPRGTAGF